MAPRNGDPAARDDGAPFGLVLSPRLRRSPFFDATVAHGVRAFTVYNHMLLPAVFEGPVAEYQALLEAVTIWDVGAQRQVEIVGPDAAELTQYLCTRDVGAIPVGRARYTLVCNHAGGILNDPVLLRLAADRFWLSLSDRDIGLWAQAIAFERGFDVTVFEPDVAPVQIQGPRSIDLVRELFGDDIAELGYYRLAETELDGVPLVVSRTGWSGELGFEIFLCDGDRGAWLWDVLFAAGERHGARPAAPNQIRRIEAGILSYGSDIDDATNPFEIGLGRLVDLEGTDDFVGREALRRIHRSGPARRLMGLVAGGPSVGSWDARTDVLAPGGGVIGTVTSMVYSPRFEANLGLALLATEHAEAGSEVDVQLQDGARRATVSDLPFVVSVR